MNDKQPETRIVSIGAGPTEKERAEELRDEIGKHLAVIADLMTDGRRDGLSVNFNIGPPDAFGRHGISMLEVSKKLA